MQESEYTLKYQWGPKWVESGVAISEYVNDQLREVMELREDVVMQSAVAILRAKGHIVIEPRGADETDL